MNALDRLRLLQVRPLLRHPGRLLVVLGSIGVAAAVLVGVLSVPSSLQTAAQYASELLPPDSVLVVSPSSSGLDQAVTAEISAVEGVEHAAAAVRRKVLSEGRGELTVLGVDATWTQIDAPITPARCRFSTTDIALGAIAGPGAGASAGESVAIRARTGKRSAITVAAVASCPELSRFDAGRVLLTTITTAQDLSDASGRVDLVAVIPEGDKSELIDRLRTTLDGRAAVQDPRTSVVQATDTIAPLTQGVTVVAGIAAVVAGFVVFSAMAMAVNERRSHFAVLRAIGMRRGHARSGMLREAALLGLAGGTVGALAGLELGRYLVDRAPSLVVDAVGYRPVFAPPSMLVPGVIAGVVLTSIVAAISPARRVVEITPMEAMRAPEVDGSATDRRLDTRLAIASVVAAVAAGVTLGNVTGAGSSLAFALASAAVILGLLAAAAPLAAASGWLVEHLGVSGQLASIDLVRSQRRTVGALLSTVIAVSTLVGFRGLVDDIQSTYTSRLASLGEADLVVQAGRTDGIAVHHRIMDSTLDAITDLPEIERVSRASISLLNIGDEIIQLNAVGRDAPDPALGGVPAEEIASMHRGEGVIVNATFAHRQAVTVGDTVELPTPEGNRRTPVLAIGGYFSLTPGGVLAMDDGLAREWFGSDGASNAYVWVRGTTREDRAQALRSVQRLLADSEGSLVKATTGGEYVRGLSAQVRAIPGLLNSILVATLVAAVLALVNTISMSIAERRRELAVLRSMGARRRTLVRSLVLGTLSVGSLGTAIGVLVGLGMHPLHVRTVSELATGSKIDYRFDPALLAFGTVGGLAILIVGSVFPARRAARTDVLGALREGSD